MICHPVVHRRSQVLPFAMRIMICAFAWHSHGAINGSCLPQQLHTTIHRILRVHSNQSAHQHRASSGIVLSRVLRNVCETHCRHPCMGHAWWGERWDSRDTDRPGLRHHKQRKSYFTKSLELKLCRNHVKMARARFPPSWGQLFPTPCVLLARLGVSTFPVHQFMRSCTRWCNRLGILRLPR